MKGKKHTFEPIIAKLRESNRRDGHCWREIEAISGPQSHPPFARQTSEMLRNSIVQKIAPERTGRDGPSSFLNKKPLHANPDP
jgi:hypothetical protein